MPKKTNRQPSWNENNPPSDLTAEEVVLGSILVEPESLEKVLDLSPGDFYRDKYRWTFQAMLNLHRRGEPIGPSTVNEELAARGLLEAVQPGLVYSLIEDTPTAVYAESYASTIKRLSAMRELRLTAGKIADIAYGSEGSISIDEAYDKATELIEESKRNTNTRRLVVTNPRIIGTNPHRYRFNVNGADINLRLGEVSSWVKFRSAVIAQLDFVPIKPNDWDKFINDLLQKAARIEAPTDASEETQIKIQVKRWLDRMPETDSYEQLPAGAHVIRSHNDKDYYFFQSTPLLGWLRRELGRQVGSQDLWVMVEEWAGVRRSIRIGSQSARLWGLPVDFMEEQSTEESEGETPGGQGGEQGEKEESWISGDEQPEVSFEEAPDWF